MNFDKEKAQKLIDETIGSEYKVSEAIDRGKYIFIGWQHKIYEPDDERGHRIGVGPIAFNKETQEYKLLGSGELLNEEYSEYLFSSENDSDNSPVIPNREEVKSGVLRRKHVNREDIYYLVENFNKEIGEAEYYLEHSRYLNIDISKQAMVNLDNESAISYLMTFWDEIGLTYTRISQTKLLVNRTFEP